jgi:hypothetical protein
LDQQPAGGRLIEQSGDIVQRALAGARGADQRPQLALAKLEVDVASLFRTCPTEPGFATIHAGAPATSQIAIHQLHMLNFGGICEITTRVEGGGLACLNVQRTPKLVSGVSHQRSCAGSSTAASMA